MKKSHNYDLGKIESANGGLDAFFEAEPQMVTPPGQTKVAVIEPVRRKIASVDALREFQRLSSDTLVHKSTQDLWTLRKEGESYFIERLFQDNGQPLKG